MNKAEFKIISYNLSKQAIEKLDSICESVGRSRSSALERILMNASEKTLYRYARRNPDYNEGCELVNESEI